MLTLARAVDDVTVEFDQTIMRRRDPVPSEPKPVQVGRGHLGRRNEGVANALEEEEGPFRAQRGGKYSSKDADVRKMIDRKNNEEVERMLREHAERSDESG